MLSLQEPEISCTLLPPYPVNALGEDTEQSTKLIFVKKISPLKSHPMKWSKFRPGGVVGGLVHFFGLITITLKGQITPRAHHVGATGGQKFRYQYLSPNATNFFFSPI